MRDRLAYGRYLLAVIFLLGASASPGWAAGALHCDIESLRAYPLMDILANRAVPLTSPELFFPPPDKPAKVGSSAFLDEAGSQRLRAALQRGLATFKPEERPVLMLAAISRWINGDHGLLNFFVLEDGVFLDEVLDVLKSQGLDAYADLFREGRAQFGVNYGTQQQRYDRWSDGYGKIRDLGLDAALHALSDRYYHMPTLLRVAAERAAASPELAALYEPLRLAAPEEQKLDYLITSLQRCLNVYDAPASVLARIKQLPAPYGWIFVVSVFEDEMLNGSVQQFFVNTPGAVAPEVVEALKDMGLSAHAEAVQKGIDMFDKPYPRDLTVRRPYMERKGATLDDALTALTDDVDDGAMRKAMLKLARGADILPK